MTPHPRRGHAVCFGGVVAVGGAVADGDRTLVLLLSAKR
jgi:hypothetical protein